MTVNIFEGLRPTSGRKPYHFLNNKSNMESNFLIYRINTLNGMRDYKVAKCSYSWCISPRDCWRFSFKGAKSIAERLNLSSRGFYIYGYEQVFD